MVKKADQEVQRKLELSIRAAIQPKMPVLYVVLGSEKLHEHAPRGRRQCVACDPVPADLLSRCHLLKPCICCRNLLCWKVRQGHDLSDERVRSPVVVVIRLKSQILYLKKRSQCVL